MSSYLDILQAFETSSEQRVSPILNVDHHGFLAVIALTIAIVLISYGFSLTGASKNSATQFVSYAVLALVASISLGFGVILLASAVGVYT
ncbi:unnamed protein product [Kuraishia capsulata CBS 1993]|uniref:Dolichyl-diphosphooligosaccharide-protein glycosyltransferase subunit OST5 n=1 Tax=Kuraishia capsulata CBS 1993 TaxID=1382522 RepID=W6MSE0_9ASCO|nr:uncharacterized protein KUCA_T00005296001 [Kuraishia capsulata CBS 1993]CDK29308.1 unnamed protein product [Kuraishia capsulata CBS 1993]